MVRIRSEFRKGFRERIDYLVIVLMCLLCEYFSCYGGGSGGSARSPRVFEPIAFWHWRFWCTKKKESMIRCLLPKRVWPLRPGS